MTIAHRSPGKGHDATGVLIFLLLILSSVRVTAAPATVEPVQQADAPVYHVGESWTMAYGGGDEEPAHLAQLTVIATTPGTTRLTDTSRGGTSHEEEYDGMGRLTRSGDVAYEPNLDTLRFPMSIGMSWHASYQIVSAKHTRAVTAQVSVDGAGIIHVQAGDFFAFRLVSRGVIAIIHGSQFRDQKSFERTYWYAPSVKRVVKSETKTYAIGARQAGQSTQAFELVKYLSAPLEGASGSSPAEGQ